MATTTEELTLHPEQGAHYLSREVSLLTWNSFRAGRQHIRKLMLEEMTRLMRRKGASRSRPFVCVVFNERMQILRFIWWQGPDAVKFGQALRQRRKKGEARWA